MTATTPPLTERTTMTTKTKRDYKSFITEVLEITQDCEGYGLVTEINEVAKKYETYFAATPIPQSVAIWVNDLFSLIDNVEGSELQRELKELKSPLKGNK